MFYCQLPFYYANEPPMISRYLAKMLTNKVVISGDFKYIQISIHPCLLKYHGLSMGIAKPGSRMQMMNYALILIQFLNKTISNKGTYQTYPCYSSYSPLKAV